MNHPNFFIIGAPKCGTTSVASWLSQHPEIYMSPTKEPHYFSTDFPVLSSLSRSDYLGLFAHARSEHTAVGEASVWYLRSEVAIPRIEKQTPKARYIVLLRNPVEMAPSLHWQAVFTGDEDVADFSMAWRLQDARVSGEALPKGCRDGKLVEYHNACRLGEQLNRLYRTVDQERVLTVFLEDIQRDVHREWARILEFLGVSQWTDLEFSTENSSKHWRRPWVRDLNRFYSRMRRRLGVPPLGWGIMDRLARSSVQEAERKPINQPLRSELVQTFSDDIDLLAELTGRDLSHWKTV
ncbi:MAG: sulfotransferase [Halothiobacillus sp.]|jgi:hypothetical protein|nr:sulfotransferase [Halothiobacillus sp.]